MRHQPTVAAGHEFFLRLLSQARGGTAVGLVPHDADGAREYVGVKPHPPSFARSVSFSPTEVVRRRDKLDRSTPLFEV